ncbi:Solute carrier family 13 member 1 [Fukomys damarensis]|uniref:Solute carrier family 13 member 1 n=1 Tax=Fukomys damarensis TaxID=885580 RepID=A0A091DC38_FUKDA|nr:Solute carrier family 13 member 1 [Fukomys damarensis]
MPQDERLNLAHLHSTITGSAPEKPNEVKYKFTCIHEAECAYVLFVVAILWVTEALPLSVTALLPGLMFPMFGILPSTHVASTYFKDFHLLLIGVICLATSIEKWNLHKRIALRMVMIVGVNPAWLTLGFMISTAFLSMWLSNTSTAAMVMPIVEAVSQQIIRAEAGAEANQMTYINEAANVGLDIDETAVGQETKEKKEKTKAAPGCSNDTGNISSKIEVRKNAITGKKYRSKKDHMMCKLMCLCIAYSSTIGGLTTITGTSTNLIFTEHFNIISECAQIPGSSGVAQTSVVAGRSQPGIHPKPRTLAKPAHPRTCLDKSYTCAQASVKGLPCAFSGKDPNQKPAQTIGTEEHSLQPKALSDNWYIEASERGTPTYQANLLRPQPQACPANRYQEIMTLVLFIIMALLWFSRDPGFVPGWSELFRHFKEMFKCGKSQTAKEKACAEVIMQEYQKLGPMRYQEIMTLVLFIIMALLWFSRDPGFVPGWSELFRQYSGFVTDSTVALIIGLLFFLIPAKILTKTTSTGEIVTFDYSPLITWKEFQSFMPWDIAILVGGGFALADGCEVSGLSTWIGNKLSPLGSLPLWLIILICSLIVTSLTEVASNPATVTIFLPVLSPLAEAIQVNPLLILLPSTLCTSFAFLLPVANPPNAIVFSYGHLKVTDMVKAGLGINIFGVAVVMLGIFTWISPMFDLYTYPSWAPTVRNVTVP